MGTIVMTRGPTLIPAGLSTVTARTTIVTGSSTTTVPSTRRPHRYWFRPRVKTKRSRPVWLMPTARLPSRPSNATNAGTAISRPYTLMVFPVVSPVALTLETSDGMGGPLVWTGALFGTAWEDRRDRSYDIYFNRLDPAGKQNGSGHSHHEQ